MEQNNFKLFETANETIHDIYDFVLRYFRTLGLSIFRPKKFIQLLSTYSPYKQVVRPYNFMLISFIILVIGIELVKEPLLAQEEKVTETLISAQQENFGNRDYQLNQKNNEPTEITETAQLLDQILELNTKSLISRFLPALLLFILISKMIERALCKAFHEDTEYGYVYIYGISSSCSVFAIILILIYAGDYYTWLEKASLELFAGLILSIFSISFTMIIFPAFLIARALKIHEINFFKRAFVFSILTFFNFVISSAYIYALIPDVESTSNASVFEAELDENVFFVIDHVQKTVSGIQLSISHSESEIYTFSQGEYSWVNAADFYDEPTMGLFNASAMFDNKGRNDAEIRLKSYLNYDLNLTIDDPVELAVFDSLYNANAYFIIELALTDMEGLFKNGLIELNEESKIPDNVNFSN